MPESDPFQQNLEIINKANQTDVLMKLLCKELGLIPHQTTHDQFVKVFTDLQKAALEAKKEVQQFYMSSAPAQKERKKRTPKLV